MSIFDTFKGKKYKKELDEVLADKRILETVLTPELEDVAKQIKKKEELESKIIELNKECEILQLNKFQLENEVDNLKSQSVALSDNLLYEEFSLYENKYPFSNSDEYRERLDKLREEQKDMIKSKTACFGDNKWTVNGSLSKGKKMVNDMIKVVLRSFNNECDTCVTNVKFNNVQMMEKRILKSYEALNKLGIIMQVRITNPYLNSKLQELHLSFEYQQKKQQEKEEQREIREQMREEARLQKEIEEARKEITKERAHYENAFKKIELQIEKASNEEDKSILLVKKEEIESKIQELQQSLNEVDYREANKRAGYVYIISNIGSFGENVYKIGMTRRLEPMDRVTELGDASVPFGFDVHALIFTDDAPTLENALHKRFEDRRINMVNLRREYFNVTLEEIEEAVKDNFDKTVEFNRIAEAEQYRESKNIRKALK